jgi:hypothetical protein
VREKCVGWVVCEVLLQGAFSRYRNKKTKNILLFCFWVQWVWFPTPLASIDLPGAMVVVRLAGECPCKSY